MGLFIKKSVLTATILLVACSVAEAQLGKRIMGKVAQTANEKLTSASANASASVAADPGVGLRADGAVYYVGTVVKRIKLYNELIANVI